MDPITPVGFDSFRAAIKRRWAALLQEGAAARTAAPGPVTPEMLVFLIDDSLARLLQRAAAVDAPADRPMCQMIAFAPIRDGGQCGLHLLLGYYLAGARAIRETLPPNRAQDREWLLAWFHRLAVEEMAVLCDHCIHRGGDQCSLPVRFMEPPAKSFSARDRPAGS